MPKKSTVLLICVIFFLISVIPHLLRQAGVLFAQEQITITTYYPSPYGSYNELQLFPHSTPVTACNAATRGTMYYDSDESQIKVCDGAGNWIIIGGVPSGAVMFFNLSSCPSGWAELTLARGRYVVGLPSGGTLAGTAGTALSNMEDRPAGAHYHGLLPFNAAGIYAQVNEDLFRTDEGRSTNAFSLTLGNTFRIESTSNLFGKQRLSGPTLVPNTNAPYIQLLVCQKQ